MDKICYNGEIIAPNDLSLGIDNLLTSNYIYQDIHCFKHIALHIDWHTEIALSAYKSLYGKDFSHSLSSLSRSIDSQLKENKYPCRSNHIRLYLMPEGWIVTTISQLLYEGYVVWHSRAKALITQYENAFSGRPTSVSLTCGEFAQSYAKGRGADLALRENYDGILTGAGDLPLVGIKNSVAYITPLECGATESVQRRLVQSLCKASKVELHQEPIYKSDCVNYDELFVFNIQGITNILSCERQMFFNIVTKRIAEALPSLT